MSFVIWFIFVAGPVYYLITGLQSNSYQEKVPTAFFFDVGIPEGGVTLPRVAGNDTLYWDLNSLIIRETEDIVFVPTRVIEKDQLHTICGPSALNPGHRCENDNICRQVYDDVAAYCSVENNTCMYTPFEQW